MPAPLTCPLGERFGSLVALGDGEPIPSSGRMRRTWLFRCDCGETVTRTVSEINAGRRQACSKCLLERRARHGHARAGKQSSEYFSWVSLRNRCNNKRDKNYKGYGGRGIRVCARWADFSAFFEDMGPKPSRLRHEIDRIEVNGHYSCGKCAECIANGWPANCQWATDKEQGRNKRNNRLITFDGRTQPLSAWAEERGMDPITLAARLRDGHSVEVALTAPVIPAQVLDPAKDKRKRAPTRRAVLEALTAGPGRTNEIAARANLKPKATRQCLRRLRADGIVDRGQDRCWRLCG